MPQVTGQVRGRARDLRPLWVRCYSWVSEPDRYRLPQRGSLQEETPQLPSPVVDSTARDTSSRDLRRGLTLALHCGSRVLLGPTRLAPQSFAAKLRILSAAEEGKAWKGKIRGAIIIVPILQGSLQRVHNLASEGLGALHSCLFNKGPPFA